MSRPRVKLVCGRCGTSYLADTAVRYFWTCITCGAENSPYMDTPTMETAGGKRKTRKAPPGR